MFDGGSIRTKFSDDIGNEKACHVVIEIDQKRVKILAGESVPGSFCEGGTHHSEYALNRFLEGTCS